LFEYVFLFLRDPRDLRKILSVVVHSNRQLTKNVLTTKRTKVTKKILFFLCPLGKIYFPFVVFEYFVVKFPSHFGCGSAVLRSTFGRIRLMRLIHEK